MHYANLWINSQVSFAHSTQSVFSRYVLRGKMSWEWVENENACPRRISKTHLIMQYNHLAVCIVLRCIDCRFNGSFVFCKQHTTSMPNAFRSLYHGISHTKPLHAYNISTIKIVQWIAILRIKLISTSRYYQPYTLFPVNRIDKQALR